MPAPDKKDPKSPATTSFEWDDMIDNWVQTETLLGGTEAMRAAGRLYLPQHEEETDFNYNERLNTNVLFNVMEMTLDSFVGRPFSEPVQLSDDMPEEIREMTDDIDLQGNNISTFCREWFREGIAKGFAHVLIDMPRLSTEDKEFRTLEDARREGRRPYWTLIKPENLIFAEAKFVNTPFGTHEVYTHVRIRQEIVERQGFAQTVTEQILVLEPGLFEVWQKVRPVKKKKPEWRMVESGETGLDFIPLVTYYSNRKSFLLSKPPLDDLAFMNIRHWQSNSDQINVLTVARFPMLAVAGATDQSGTMMRIGPRQLLGTKDANGRFYYVEHTGASINAGKEDLDKLEEQMGSYGAEFLKRKPGNETATGRALDSAEAMSPLQDMTVRFIDSMNNALKFTGAWINQPQVGTALITTDFGPEEIEEADTGFLARLREKRDISRLAVIEEAKRRGIISEDYDPEADLRQLELEVELLEGIVPIVPGTFDPAEGENVGGKKKKEPEGEEGGDNGED